MTFGIEGLIEYFKDLNDSVRVHKKELIRPEIMEVE
jgi:hypothetical protein